ncbi:MAG: ABC transporter permease [Rhodospirillales bacterium]|nr:ABC transporter permease [Rhodospirillales bacterium]
MNGLATWFSNGFIRYSPLLILVVIWEAVSRFGLVSTDVLPSFTNVMEAGSRLFDDGDIYRHTAASLYRGFTGLFLAIFIGGTLGIFMAWSKIVNAVLGPLVEMFYPLPKSALIPVTALWLGFGDSSKILLIFLGCMLPVTLGAFNGARGAEQTLIWTARSLGASRLRTLRDVILPSAMPELLNGIRTVLALSFILLVASELIVAREGLGFMLSYLGDSGNYDGMFAVVIIVSALGFAADRGYLYIVRRMLAWRE